MEVQYPSSVHPNMSELNTLETLAQVLGMVKQELSSPADDEDDSPAGFGLQSMAAEPVKAIIRPATLDMFTCECARHVVIHLQL